MIMRHIASMQPRQIAPPALTLGILAGTGLAIAGFPQPLAALLTLYTLIILAGSSLVGFHRRDASAVLLPLALVIMHLCWGIGFFFPKRHPEVDRKTTNIYTPPPPPPNDS